MNNRIKKRFGLIIDKNTKITYTHALYHREYQSIVGDKKEIAQPKKRSRTSENAETIQ